MRDATVQAAPCHAIVVDDHRRMRRLERQIVRQFLPHFSVEEMQDAESAIASVRARSPDLVLMDVHLPGIDGLEATRRILEIAPGTTVIVVSLTDDWRYFRLALEAGAAAFVPKGLLLEQLPPLLERLSSCGRGSVRS